MDLVNDRKNSNEIILEQISIPLIKQVVTLFIKEDNKVKDEINNDIVNLIEKLDGLLEKSKLKKYVFVKLAKLTKFIDTLKNISEKNQINNENKIEIFKINKFIISVSICFIRININCRNHYTIRKYLKILLVFFVNGDITMNNFFFVLEILLKSIIETLKLKTFNHYQILELNDEPLKFINDIIETIINFPMLLIKNDKFIEQLINIFNKFIERAKKVNIIIKENISWFKLLQNNSINHCFELLEDKSYQNSIKIISSFLQNIYQKNIPKNFYPEIFKRSAIDLLFYINSVPIIKDFIKTDLNKPKKTELDKGVYLLGTNYIKKRLNFPSTTEFSLIIPFHIIYTKSNQINIFNLIQKDNIIQVFIKDSILNIDINKDFRWSSEIKINKRVFYFLYIVFNKKNKLIQIYINHEEIAESKTKEKKFEKKCTNFPKFNKDMEAIIGDNNLYAMFGDIFFINKEFNIKTVKALFNSKGFYSNLIVRNNLNSSLVNNLIYSENYEEILNYMKTIKYEYNLIFTSNFFIIKDKLSKNSIIEYNNTNNFCEFINLNGIEFLTFMLHNFNSIIPDIKILNKYFSQTFDIITSLLSREKNKDEDYIYELDKNKFNNQLNVFFMTFLSIVKPEKNENKKFMRTLSDEIWNNLMDIFSIDVGYSSIYQQIILNILLDNRLFEQKKNAEAINVSVLDQIKIKEINNELFYKIFTIDFIFELNNINHKSLLNLIKGMCISKNKFFCSTLIEYVVKLKNEIKLYHYLKIIYENIKELKETIPKEIFILYEYVENHFDSLNHLHCKYCSYVIILCYLIKTDIIIGKNESREDEITFTYDKFKYMSNPSFLFIRCLFIENFNIENIQKLKFIKSKGKKTKFNLDVFKLVKNHPFELYKIRKFLKRFNDILSYIEYLLSLNQNENLKNIFENFFPFISEFAEKIKSRYSKNVFIKEDDEKYVNIFYSSKDFEKFFILYLQYDKENAMKEIKKYISTIFFKYMNPFYFRFFKTKFQIIDESITFQIKFEIIKDILFAIANNKEKIKEKYWNNSFLFLIIIYKNFYQNDLNVKLHFAFHSLFIGFFSFLLNNKMLLYTKLINLSFLDEEEEEIENNKLACELILDIILKFYFCNYYKKDEIMSLLINSKSTSIFYDNDDKYLKNKDKKTNNEEYIEESDDEEEDDNYEKNLFKEQLNDFSFCLYFLIYFLGKEPLFKENDERNYIKKILETIFEDLKSLFFIHKKINLHLKKVKNHGKNYEIYNEMLDLCITNKNNSSFTLDLLRDKYNQLNSQIKNDNESINNKSKSNEINTDKYTPTNNNNEKDNINKSLRVSEQNSEKERKPKEDISAEYFINKKLSKIKTKEFYFNLIINQKNSKESIKALFNPKSYFVWNKLSFIFKDYIFFSKKFKNVSKIFKIHIKNAVPNDKNNDNANTKFYLNYPTKIRNYIVDDYYRPFLKPYINFFSNDYLSITHPYVKESLLKKEKFKEEYFNSIKFDKLIPNLNKGKYFCELIKNKGNIFGYIELNEYFLVFKNSPNDDMRSSDDVEKNIKYILSIFDDKVIDTKKYSLIFYSDIKEIIKRRICLVYIGLEIFLKDNRSYMFNLFDKNILANFIDEIKMYTIEKNKLLKNSAYNIIEENHHSQSNKHNGSTNNNNKNSPNSSYPNQLTLDIDLKIIEDPLSEFKKLHLSMKNRKGELSNFNYLLLINKYSSRTYNDYNQYLVFPLLFMDAANNKKRDLSKVIALNKENSERSFEKAINNYNLFKFHFNQHYSTGGFILYYLVRLIPFTFQHIVFQSMKFDVPARLFSSMKNIFLFYEVTEDNRELIPEFFSNYEFLINLNYNDFGILDIQDEYSHLNNVDIFYENLYPEYIIKSRNSLDETDLSPWLDLIFGVKQTVPNNEQPNLFPLNSFEEFSQIDELIEKDMPLKEKRDKILENVDVLKFGVSPARMFNKLHDKMGKKNLEKIEDDMVSNAKKNEKCLNVINKYITKKIKEKILYYFINTKVNNEIEIFFKFSNKIDVFKLKLGETKYTEISLKIQEQIDFEPYSNSIFEIFPLTYCTVRHIDNSMAFVANKKVISVYQFNCMITAVENKNNKNTEDKLYKEIFIGDKKGTLHLLEIKYEYNHHEKNYVIKKIYKKKSIKIFDNYIKGLLHIERLNTIFSWSDENEGFISINNDYSLEVLNIIKFENKTDIKEILVSKYDLIFISCCNNYDIYKKNKIYCYTLNGMMISFYETHENIVKCFTEEKFNIVLWNNNVLSYPLYSFDEACRLFYCDFTKDLKAWTIKINSCQYFPKNKIYLMISSNNKATFLENNKDFI